MFFRPNVKKLRERQDIVGLGKLLRHKDDQLKHESIQSLLELLQFGELNQESNKRIIEQFATTDYPTLAYSIQYLGQLLRHRDARLRQASTIVLLRLFEQSSIIGVLPQGYFSTPFYLKKEEIKSLINHQFNEVGEDVLSALLQYLEERIRLNPRFTGGDIYLTALYAGGFNQLVELHKRIADNPATQWTQAHTHLSTAVLAGASAYKVGLDVLLAIIPFGCTDQAQNIARLINMSDGSNISKAMCEEAIRRLKALPINGENAINSCSPKLTDAYVPYTSLGVILLRKLEGLLSQGLQ